MILNKTLEMRNELNKVSYETHDIEPVKDEEITLYDRYLPQSPRPFFDKLNEGWNLSINTYKVYKPEPPFKKLTVDLQEKDSLHASLMNTEDSYVKKLLETIMVDLGVKQDQNIIANHSGQTSLTIKTIVRKKGKNKRTVIKVVSSNIARFFKFFNSIFQYYGVECFQHSFYPVLKEFMEEIDNREHSSVWKVFIFDII